MTRKQVNYINKEAKSLANYINNLVDFNNKYHQAVINLCKKNNIDIKKVTKSNELIEMEQKIKSSYEKAKNLYNELELIKTLYRSRMDISFRLRDFYNVRSMTKLPIFKKLTLTLEKTKPISNDGIPTDGVSNILEGGVSKNNIDIEKEEFEKEVKKWENKIEKNIMYPRASRIGGTIRMWGNPDAVGMINIASGKYLPLYTKDAIKVKNILDKKLYKFNKGNLLQWNIYIADKISMQFEDFNYDLENINGYIFKNNSAVVKRIKNSEEFKNILLKHKEDIINNKSFSDRFINDYNLHNAFGSVDFLNAGLDKKGNLHLYMFDTYDFNKGENAKVEAGRRQMLKGNLKGFFSIHEIIIKKKDLEKYGL